MTATTSLSATGPGLGRVSDQRFGLEMSAQALNVGQNQYALSVSSDKTGAANDVSIDPSAFSGSGLGSLSTTTSGQDAVISLGEPAATRCSRLRTP